MESRLGNDLLTEIFFKLGSCKYVIRCKCVSKRWRSLIDDQAFIRRWRQIHKKDEEEFPIDVVVQNDERAHRADCRQLLPETLKPLIQLLPLPVNNSNSKSDHIHVLDTYKNLLLCCPGQNDHSAYYLCNPYTRQWIALPPPPPLAPDLMDMSIEVGLIVDDQGESEFNLKFKVVRFIPHPYSEDFPVSGNFFMNEISDEFDKEVTRFVPPKLSRDEWLQLRTNTRTRKVEVYSSSEGGDWRQMVIYSEPFRETSRRVSYGGMLVWWNYLLSGTGEVEELMASKFDPDNAHDYCHRLAAPGTGFSNATKFNSLMGDFKGRLRFACLVDENEDPKLTIWQLHDSEWEVVSELVFSELEDSAASSLARSCNTEWHYKSVLAFHPLNQDVVYLSFFVPNPDLPALLESNPEARSLVFSCNVREKMLKLVPRRLAVAMAWHAQLPLVPAAGCPL